jgi:hypothetical protein
MLAELNQSSKSNLGHASLPMEQQYLLLMSYFHLSEIPAARSEGGGMGSRTDLLAVGSGER